MVIILIGWSSFSITYALVTLISAKHSISRTTPITYIMIIMPRVTWSVLLSHCILTDGSCGRCHSSLAGGITSSTLVDIVWNHLWHHIFPLANLWTIFHGVCLLNKEHVSMILRRFYNLRSGASILNIDTETLVGLRRLRPVLDIGTHVVRLAPNLVIVTVMIFRSRWCSISRPKTSKSWWIHLLLKQIARISVMNVRVVLKPLDQVLRIVGPTMVVKLRDSAVIWTLILDGVILRINTTLGIILWKLSLTVL